MVAVGDILTFHLRAAIETRPKLDHADAAPPHRSVPERNEVARPQVVAILKKALRDFASRRRSPP